VIFHHTGNPAMTEITAEQCLLHIEIAIAIATTMEVAGLSLAVSEIKERGL